MIPFLVSFLTIYLSFIIHPYAAIPTAYIIGFILGGTVTLKQVEGKAK